MQGSNMNGFGPQNWRYEYIFALKQGLRDVLFSDEVFKRFTSGEPVSTSPSFQL